MIQIKKIDNAASYLPRICPLDADGEFCTAVKADDEGMYAILAGKGYWQKSGEIHSKPNTRPKPCPNRVILRGG